VGRWETDGMSSRGNKINANNDINIYDNRSDNNNNNNNNNNKQRAHHPALLSLISHKRNPRKAQRRCLQHASPTSHPRA